MSNSKHIEELLVHITRKDDKNVKKTLKEILKRKAKERLISEIENQSRL